MRYLTEAEAIELINRGIAYDYPMGSRGRGYPRIFDSLGDKILLIESEAELDSPEMTEIKELMNQNAKLLAEYM